MPTYETNDNTEYFLHGDLAPIGCNNCNGCSKCCQEMGDTIVLDPYDMHLLTSHLKLVGGTPATYEILVSEDGPLELSEQRGLLLPNIKMVEEGVCPFLNEKGRCSIHSIRTGLCRLYPLARQFSENQIRYFLVPDEFGCKRITREMVTVEKWLGISDLNKYENFLLIWHKLKKETSNFLVSSLSEGTICTNQLYDFYRIFLTLFYAKPYAADFFEEFTQRVETFQKKVLL